MNQCWKPAMSTDASPSAREIRMTAHSDSSGSKDSSTMFSHDSSGSGILASDFRRFQKLIHQEAGVWLSEAKTSLLVGRLSKRLRLLQLKSFRDYYHMVLEFPEERVEMLNAILTNETHFFREPEHFQLLRNKIFPEWQLQRKQGQRNGRIRIWSAGCSTGEEPYSLAMELLTHLPAHEGWQTEIIASDLSTRALETARKGIWSMARAREIPFDYLKSYMLRGIGEQVDRIKATPVTRSLIQFSQINLNAPVYPFQEGFDLIFCRNVLIYFDKQGRDLVVGRMLKHLRPSGYLFLGHAESLQTMGQSMRSVIPTVYRSIGNNGQ
jgi:chemotaxis protein methyltransferase CheR